MRRLGNRLLANLSLAPDAIAAFWHCTINTIVTAAVRDGATNKPPPEKLAVAHC